jgi:hypothetical protein
VIRRDPSQFGYVQSRWNLERLLRALDWLNLSTLGGLSKLLKRLKISYKRARAYIRSPDPEYAEKLSLIELARLRAKYAPERYVFLYLDEFTYYRQPTLAYNYESYGSCQPLARWSYRSNAKFRVVAALNALTGQVSYRQDRCISTKLLSEFYADLRMDYPDVETLYVTQDNWPVHFHPDVLARLEPQQWPYPFNKPANWPTQPSKRAIQDTLPIQLLCLPTYASWCNPIEKLWRRLNQDLLHLHCLSDDWQALRQQVATYFDQFQLGSTVLLHYVGLLPD